MKWFKHNTNTMQDEKVFELFMAHGYEGTGLFWAALEVLAGHEKPMKTVVLKKQLNVGKRLDKVWFTIESLGLLSSKNGESFSEQLSKFTQNYSISLEKTAKRVAQHREKQKVTKNVTRYTEESNATDKIRIEKKRKDNNNAGAIAPNMPDLFNQFWDSYGRKVGKDKTIKEWNKIDAGTYHAIITAVPPYVRSTPDVQYRKHPSTWLSGKHWTDELPKAQSNKSMVY